MTFAWQYQVITWNTVEYNHQLSLEAFISRQVQLICYLSVISVRSLLIKDYMQLPGTNGLTMQNGQVIAVFHIVVNDIHECVLYSFFIEVYIPY